MGNKHRLLIMVAISMVFVSMSAAASAGSYASIDAELRAADGWRQIVETSPFKLGASALIKEVGGVPVYEMGYGTYPIIDGSTVSVPMAMEFARQHLGLSQDDLYSFVFLNTTHSAYENLILRRPNIAPKIPSMNALMDQSRPVDIMIGTEPSNEELVLASENAVTLASVPVCMDAFVFIVNADNPIDSLSVEQIKSIYKGIVKDWADVGGTTAVIEAYQRPANSGSQTAMENLVMKGEEIEGVNSNYITSGMEGLVHAVGDYDNGKAALGYTYLYYLNELVDSANIKTLAINDIYPSAENIQSGAYPFTTKYFATYREGEPDTVAKDFTDWIVSPEGQACVEQAGYIPMWKGETNEE